MPPPNYSKRHLMSQAPNSFLPAPNLSGRPATALGVKGPLPPGLINAIQAQTNSTTTTSNTGSNNQGTASTRRISTPYGATHASHLSSRSTSRSSSYPYSSGTTTTSTPRRTERASTSTSSRPQQGRLSSHRPSLSGVNSNIGLLSRATSRAASRATSSVSLAGSESHQVICAVSEGRGIRPSVGIALVNISTGEAILSQICDSQFYVKTIHKLEIYNPLKILMISNYCPPNAKSTLYSILEEELPETPIQPLSRVYWSETSGTTFVEELAFKDDVDALKVALQGNFYSTCAFAATMKYLEKELQISIVSHSLRIKYQPSEDSMMIDLSTVKSLELMQNLFDPKSKLCLLGTLNETVTKMGSRLLRSNILQPSTQKDIILEPRYDAIEELSTKEEMFFAVRKALKGFGDAERLLSKLVILPSQASIRRSEQAINNVLEIKSFISAVPILFEALASARSQLLCMVRDLCRPEIALPLMEIINEVINEDATYMKTQIDLRNQRTYAVKSGVHGLLDVARQTYKEATEDVYKHVDELNSRLRIAAEVKYDNQRKYWLRIRESDLEGAAFPPELINSIKKRGNWECQTLPIVKLNHRISDSASEVVMLSDGVVQQLLDVIRTQVPSLFRICEGIALLDMLGGFAQLVTVHDYIRPELTGTLALKAARHPILERKHPGKTVPNDVYATKQFRFQIITGRNMSGKTTYLRMIALLQIMAQVGSFVPAQYAAFPIMENLFARVSTDDSIEGNLSTFSMEMRDVAFILRNINSKSLTIIDELGRGTSTQDGLAVAIAVSEALLQSEAQVVFATHFLEITKVLKMHPGVLNLHLQTETRMTANNMPHITMLYQIASDAIEEELYGIQLARTIGFPDAFLRKAEETSKELTRRKEAKKMNSETRKSLERRKLVIALHEKLKQLKDSELSESALRSYFFRLQAEFISRMEKIERGAPDESTDKEEDAEGGEDHEMEDEEESEEDDQDEEIDYAPPVAGGYFMSGALPVGAVPLAQNDEHDFVVDVVDRAAKHGNEAEAENDSEARGDMDDDPIQRQRARLVKIKREMRLDDREVSDVMEEMGMDQARTIEVGSGRGDEASDDEDMYDE